MFYKITSPSPDTDEKLIEIGFEKGQDSNYPFHIVRYNPEYIPDFLEEDIIEVKSGGHVYMFLTEDAGERPDPKLTFLNMDSLGSRISPEEHDLILKVLLELPLLL